MRRRVLPLNQSDRMSQKQARRESDLERLNRGGVTRDELSRENSFFAPLEPAKFEIHAIGGRRIDVPGDDSRPTRLARP